MCITVLIWPKIPTISIACVDVGWFVEICIYINMTVAGRLKTPAHITLCAASHVYPIVCTLSYR